jgi:hypothetical protein
VKHPGVCAFISIGKFGGLYARFPRESWRICLGFVAFTVVFHDDWFLVDWAKSKKGGVE